MRINRNNYEAYLLDLSEGNLSDELHSELSLFLASNPDLEVELIDEFSTIENQNEESIDKDLLKFDSINNSNRKHFFIAYHEGDLKTSEQNEVLEFVSQNSTLKQEFNQFSQLHLKSSDVVYEDKKSLHAIATSNNSRGIIYWSVRIAAILLIGFILNVLYQNSSSITPKYTLTEGVSNLKPTLQHGGTVDFTKSLVSKDEEKLKSINALVAHNNSKKTSTVEDTSSIPLPNTNESQENMSDSFDKRKIKILKRNPALDMVIVRLNQNDLSKDNEIIEPLPIKNIETPPSLLAYLGEKAKEKRLLTENGRPNVVSLLNRGSNSLTGEDILAKSETEQSNSTIFQLGSLKIERITKK
jgi:hypothetical protein